MDEDSKHSVLSCQTYTQSTCLLAEVPLEILYLLGYFPIKWSPTVKAERRKRYPKNWEALARQCKEQAGWICEMCHIEQGRRRISHRTGAEYLVYHHAAHRDHDIGNPNPILLCLCPTCHGRYDYQYRMHQKQLNHERLKHRVLLSNS
jgi:hypothetical protein